ncbi:MAG: NADH-quinone oxidoreductase subunit J [Bacteroidia bacterium]
MSSASVIFYLLCLLIGSTAFLAVTSTKIFRAAIYLLFSLIGVAGLYFYMDQEFIAAVQIIVYVGGIIVLIIFSIFLTQDSGSDMQKPQLWRSIASGAAVVFGFLFTWLCINEFNLKSTAENNPLLGTTKELGQKLLSTEAGGYILPFEMVGLLLLAAMIGCIVIAVKIKNDSQEKGEITL